MADGDLTGTEHDLDVGAPAHGGFCVARLDDDPRGRVVFVRHALPGERVRVRITEDGGRSYCRADAVQILRAAPDRVVPPCPHAAPGRCGGCDWQHASAGAQRAIKAAIVREQLHRLAGLDLEVTVEPLPGGLLGWRTRTTYAVDGRGRAGLRRHRSHDVELLDACPLGAPGVGDAAALRRSWPGFRAVEVARGDDGVSVLTHRARGPQRRPPDRVQLVHGPGRLVHHAAGRRFQVAAGGFWQGHPAAADTFARCVVEQLDPRPGDRVVDLYAGAGLFTAVLAAVVGPAGSAVGLEADAGAVADARDNLADLPHAEVRRGVVRADIVAGLAGSADLVVLDPPRSGAGAAVLTAVLGGTARAVCYVACDPAALARDVAVATGAGWRLAALRAFDAYPMTHHVECVAQLVRA